MTDSTAPRRPVRTRRRPYHVWMTQNGRARVIGVSLLLFLLGWSGGYLFERLMTNHIVAEARDLNQQVQAESQKIKGQIASQNVNIAALQSKLTSVQAALEAIMPAENTYNITPNQSVIVGKGQMNIALVGSPTNDSVNLDINGKQQSVAAGQVIHVGSDPSNACQVYVQSFDMFRVVLTATCGAPKPQ